MRLAYTPPLDWAALMGFLGPRATPGIEWVRDGRYGRTFRVGGQPGVVEVGLDKGAPDTRSCIEATVVLLDGPAHAQTRDEASARLRRLLDLDTDPAPVAAKLSNDPHLRHAVTARPGLRVPGAWDGFELAVRAILGQQVSVAAATTLAGRLVEAYGDPLPAAPLVGLHAPEGGLRLFPQPGVLAKADLRPLGLPAARAAAISGLAAAVAADNNLLKPDQDVATATQRLMALPGVGPWTAQYIAMRWFRDADAFPASDLGLRKSAAGAGGAAPTAQQLLRQAEAWRPFRAYAAMHLWTSLAER